MKKPRIIQIIILLIFTLMLSGCSGNGSGFDSIPTPEPIDIEDVSFHLTDELKDYMSSEGYNNLAIITVLCRS